MENLRVLEGSEVFFRGLQRQRTGDHLQALWHWQTKCGDAKRDRWTVRDFPFLCIEDRKKSLGKITRGSFEKFIIIS